MCYDKVCPMFGGVLLFEFWGDPVGVWEGAWSGLPVEVATHLARIAQREGQREGATETAPLPQRISFSFWVASLSAIQGGQAGFDPV